MEQFVEPLRSACTLKVKPNSVKQEYEKQDELKRSALRSVAALLQIPKAGMIISKLQLEDISILLFFLLLQTRISISMILLLLLKTRVICCLSSSQFSAITQPQLTQWAMASRWIKVRVIGNE